PGQGGRMKHEFMRPGLRTALTFCAMVLTGMLQAQVAAPTGVAHEVRLPGENLSPTTLAVAPDGRVWFTLSAGNAIARVEADGSGFVRFDLPQPGSSPRIIALGSDGNMWFSEHEGNRIGRITPDG